MSIVEKLGFALSGTSENKELLNWIFCLSN